MADGDIHVKPQNDIAEHGDENCICHPKLEPVNQEDGSIGWMFLHNSFDGRENLERESSRNKHRL